MPIDPALAALLAETRPTATDVAGARAAHERDALRFTPPEQRDAVGSVRDTAAGALPLRVYHPEGPAGSTATIVWFHGGGWTTGSLETGDIVARALCRLTPAVVVSVDYRLAPEHPYPAAIDDAFAAYRGLLDRGHAPSSILFSGESAGGGVALALGLAVQRAGLAPPVGIVAICPFTDLTLSGPSIEANSGDDPASHRDLLAQLAASYFQGHEPTDPMVSPYFGDLGCLPPIFLSAAEGEVLESDTTRFASKAANAGVDVTLEMVADSVHSYPIFPFLPETRDVLLKLRRWTDRIVHTTPSIRATA
jgi:acetyl esterase/lipase